MHEFHFLSYYDHTVSHYPRKNDHSYRKLLVVLAHSLQALHARVKHIGEDGHDRAIARILIFVLTPKYRQWMLNGFIQSDV